MYRKTSRVIILKDETLYVIKRITKRWGVYYSLPGGGVEEGESAEEAAIREAKEELNIDIEIVSHFKNYLDRKIKTYHQVFIAKEIGGIFQEGSGEEYINKDQDNLHIPFKLPIKEIKESKFVPFSCKKDLLKLIKEK